MTDTVGNCAAAFRKRRLGLLEPVLFVVGPAEAVQIGAVVRFDRQRPLHERHGFVQLLPALREHVPE